MKSSVVFLAAASGLLAACNPSPEDFGPQREDVIDARANSQEQDQVDTQALTVSPPDSINYVLPVGQRKFEEWIVEFRPEGDPDTLCVVAYATEEMQCWKAPSNE